MTRVSITLNALCTGFLHTQHIDLHRDAVRDALSAQTQHVVLLRWSDCSWSCSMRCESNTAQTRTDAENERTLDLQVVVDLLLLDLDWWSG